MFCVTPPQASALTQFHNLAVPLAIASERLLQAVYNNPAAFSVL